jgi:mRNA interferase MazF
MASGIARGDVRLYQFQPPDKRRPVVVLTRDSAIQYLSTATVAPITATIRGVPSEVLLSQDDGMKGPCAVNLHNLITVSMDRLGRRVGRLHPERMKEICAAIRFSLGCDRS